MDSLNEIVTKIDDFVWGPVMLVLLGRNRYLPDCAHQISHMA